MVEHQFPDPYRLNGPIATAVRTGDRAGEAKARAAQSEAKIAQAIQKNLATGSLSNEQLARLRGLLRGAQR